MKIAFLNMYSGLVDRGAETFVHEVAQRLSKNHDVTLFQHGVARGRERYKVENIDVDIDWKRKDTSLTFSRKLFTDYWSRKVAIFSLRTISMIRKEKYDIVIPLNGGWQPAFVRIVTWLYGGKMVITGQAGIGWDERNNLWSFPDTFVALSEKAKTWAKKVNPLIASVKIPNGVDVSKFNHQGKKTKVKLKRPIILAAAAFTPTKRLDLVIKAASKLEDVSLLVVGQGDEKISLEKMGKRLMKGRFTLTSFPFEKMPEVYRAANVFTLVSEPYYAFEIVLVEAMASGLPVVATDDPIRKEIVGEAGLLVTPEDTKSYAKALKKALEINWGEKPRKQAEKFSWEKIAKQYEDLFESLAK